VRALLAVSEQHRNDAVAIWVPYRVFEKSDREGGFPQGVSPFRFQPNISRWPPSSAFGFGLGARAGFGFSGRSSSVNGSHSAGSLFLTLFTRRS
jgi:hypothetical protein